MNLFRHESSDPKHNAQRNLQGRTHYVDDDTLRFHKSRVLTAESVDGGLLFAITTSDALDMNNSKRGYRYVIFDLFGTVVARTELASAYKRHEPCFKAMWAALNAVDAKAHTLEAIKVEEAHYASEMARLRAQVAA